LLIYDIEIANAIPSRDGLRTPNISYCEGWTDFLGMGVSVLACYDYVRDHYRVFCKDNLADFAALAERHDVLVGFNNLRFDNQVLTAHGIALNQASCYDLFIEIQRGLGLDFNNPAQRRSGYNLQGMAYANFRAKKSGSGADAPALWQSGKTGSVIDYCLSDVHLTKRLIDRVIRGGALADPLDERKSISIRRPGA